MIDHEALRRRYDDLPIDELRDLVESGQLEGTAQPIAESVLADRREELTSTPPEALEPEGTDPDLPPPDPRNPYSPPRSRLSSPGQKRASKPLRRYYALAGATSFVVADLITTSIYAYIDDGGVHWVAAQLLYRVVVTAAAGAIAGLIFRPFEALVPLPSRPVRGAVFFGGVTAAIYIVWALTADEWQPSWWFMVAGMVMAYVMTGAALGWAVDWLDQRFGRPENRRA